MGKVHLVWSCEQRLGARLEKDRKERESVAVMCNGELYRGRRACEAKRDLNWRWSDMWVSPHDHPPARRSAVRWRRELGSALCVLSE